MKLASVCTLHLFYSDIISFQRTGALYVLQSQTLTPTTATPHTEMTAIIAPESLESSLSSPSSSSLPTLSLPASSLPTSSLLFEGHKPQSHNSAPLMYNDSLHPQSANASLPISVADSGMLIVSKLEQPLKARYPIVATLFPMLTDARFTENANAPSPMFVTESGMLIVVSELQAENAC